MEHIPGGGEKKIFDEKPRWQARSKIGSLDNIDHQPLGGRVRITNNKLNWGYKSKVSEWRKRQRNTVFHTAGVKISFCTKYFKCLP